MASSGTAVFTLNQDQLINASLRLIRVLQDGQSAGSSDLFNCSQALNILLKSWQTRGLILSLLDQYVIPLLIGHQTYTIGPTGADFTAPRPLRVLDGSFIKKTVFGTDTNIEVISRLRYMRIVPNKATSSFTEMIYYEPNIDIAGGSFGTAGPSSMGTGYGTLYVFPPMSTNDYTLYLNVQRPVYDMTTGTDEFDLSSEWLLALKWGLAAQIADEYEVPEERIKRYQQMAMMYLADLEAWQIKQNTIAFGDQRIRIERAQDAALEKE